MKIILIGRGSSIVRCTPEFINHHDLIGVVNKFIFRGYEQYVGNKADVQFRNGTCECFTEAEINKIGLKKIVYSHDNNIYPNYPNYYRDIEIIDPKKTIRNEIKKIIPDLNPSSGLIGMYYMLKTYDVDELSLVGYDYYELNKPPYYFNPKDADNNLKYLWNSKYKNNTINVKSGHDTDKSIEFTKIMITQYPNVRFNLMTDSSEFKNFEADNIKYL